MMRSRMMQRKTKEQKDDPDFDDLIASGHIRMKVRASG